MGRKLYEVNDKMFVIDDETGKVFAAYAVEEQIPPNDMTEIIKTLAKKAAINKKD